MYWRHYPKAAPRPKPKPGKARKKFGATWWGKKWVDILSEYECDQRMSRGRAYARADMVTDFKTKSGCISASVKGSMGNYHVTINFKKYAPKDWKVIMGKLRATPILLSKLLNNEMPEEMREAIGYSFIPESFNAMCSCPDYVNPCKHIAAVFYTVADEIDYDPMILFKLRGMDKGELFDKLGLENKPMDEVAVGKEKKKAGSVKRRDTAKTRLGKRKAAARNKSRITKGKTSAAKKKVSRKSKTTGAKKIIPRKRATRLRKNKRQKS